MRPPCIGTELFHCLQRRCLWVLTFARISSKNILPRFPWKSFFLIDIWYNLIIIKFTSAEYVLMSNWHAYSHVYIALSCYQTFVPFPKFSYAPLVYHFPTADLFPVIIVLELFFGHLLKILNHTVFPSAEVQGCATISSHISSFTPELHSMLWIYHSLTIHSSVEWHLSCF